MNAKTHHDNSSADLRALVELLYATNRELLDAFHQQRDAYETVLTQFAASGYQPAAKVLLACRKAQQGADRKAREDRAARKRA